MQAIKIKGFQQMVSYRKPASLMYKETFPLPPYSTVIGMVHTACNFNSYQPMKVSVQGTYHSIVSDFYTKYELIAYEKPDPKRAPRQNMAFMDNGERFILFEVDGRTIPRTEEYNWPKYGVNRSTGNVELLTDVNLVLHICPENQALIPVIMDGMLNPKRYPALGRHEDLLRIDDVKIVDISYKSNQEPHSLEYDAYIPLKYFEKWKSRKPKGTIYNINKVYDPESVKKGLRRWQETVTVKYAAQGSYIPTETEIHVDSDGMVIFLA